MGDHDKRDKASRTKKDTERDLTKKLEKKRSTGDLRTGDSIPTAKTSQSAERSTSSEKKIKATTISRGGGVRNPPPNWQDEDEEQAVINKTSTLADLLPPDKNVKLVDLQVELSGWPAELADYKELQLLRLKKNKLSVIGPAIGNFHKMNTLSVTENNLTELPPEIGKLETLTELDLRKNKLHRLIPEVGNLINLESLLLRNNHLLALPEQISKLVNLKVLELHQNELRSITPSIDKLKQLSDLDLQFNHLTTLPKMKHIKNLTKVSLGYNQFAQFPIELCQVKSLKILDMEGNKLTTLPVEIGKLVNLQEILMNKNALTALPKETGLLVNLKKLHVSANELHDLPLEMKTLTKLEDLDLRNNPLCSDKLQSGDWKKLLLPSLIALKALKLGNTAVTNKIIPAGGAKELHADDEGKALSAADKKPQSATWSARKGGREPQSIFTLFGESGAEPERTTPRSGSDRNGHDGSGISNEGKATKSIATSSSNTGNKDQGKFLPGATTNISYEELLKSLESPQLPTPTPSSTSTSKSSSLIKDYSIAEDINKAGLQRGKKVAVQKGAHTKSHVFQMEDVNLVVHPWENDSRKALFCVFDGHAGVEAALSAKELMPKELASQLKERGILSKRGISADNLADVLPLSFLKVDEQMIQHECVGSTATVVVVWQNGSERYLQAANVGDSRAYLCRGEGVIKLSKDHKLEDPEEKTRIVNSGFSINEGQTRINGLAVTRALGDRFAKDNNSGMIAVPYVSEAYKLTPEDRFLIVASDGLWDIVSGAKAYEICLSQPSAEAMAKQLIQTAVESPKCQDNVTVIVVALN